MEIQLHEATRQALKSAACYSYNKIRPEGYWWGEVVSNITPTAEYVLLRQAFGLDIEKDRDAICQYILSEQRPDGSWSHAFEAPGNVGITVEAYLVLKVLGLSINCQEMRRARDFVLSNGSMAATSMFTRVVLAGFGLFPWAALPHLPPELMILPRQFPVNLYRLASWAPVMAVTFSLSRHHQSVRPLASGLGSSIRTDFLDELWTNPADKVVPYRPTLWQLLWMNFGFFLLALAHKILGYIDALAPSDVRVYSRRKCVKMILANQEPTGDWASYWPMQYLALLALQDEGLTLIDDPIARGMEAVERLLLHDKNGKRMQVCPSPVWDTALMITGLCDAESQLMDHPHLRTAISWLEIHQAMDANANWRINKPKLEPGGFPWSPWALKVPDLDDTLAVVMAFLKQNPESLLSPCIRRAMEWTLGMQSPDGGYPAFEPNNNPSFINKLKFDNKEMFDPSCEDITGHALEVFAMILQSPYAKDLDSRILHCIKKSSTRAIKYLASSQKQETGAWYGRWGVNYIYGTSGVLCGLEHFVHRNEKDNTTGFTILLGNTNSESKATSILASSLVTPAVRFLRQCQNPDGGWGEGVDTYTYPERAGIGASTASQTSWALMALLAHTTYDDEAIILGVKYLLATQVDMEGGKSWVEQLYTGSGFPGSYDLRYDYYRHYFPMMALGRFVRAFEKASERS